VDSVSHHGGVSTHGQQSAAKGSSTTVSRSDIRLIQYLDSFGSWFGPEAALNWLFPYPLFTYGVLVSPTLSWKATRCGAARAGPSPTCRPGMRSTAAAWRRSATRCASVEDALGGGRECV
jgi:hypothetical protein